MLIKKEIPDSNIVIYDGQLPEPEGGAVNFAFIVHLMSDDDFKFLMVDPKTLKTWQTKPNLRRLIRKNMIEMDPKVIGIAKIDTMNRKCQGIYILVPYLPEHFKKPELTNQIIAKQIRAIELAKNMGAEYVSLGAFNSVISINGLLLHKHHILPITSGNALTTHCVCQSIIEACEKLLKIHPSDLKITIVGAGGNIGEALSKILIPKFKWGYLVGRIDMTKINKLAKQIPNTTPFSREQINNAIHNSGVVIFVTTATNPGELGIETRSFQPGTIVCDVSRPHNIPPELILARPDVLFIEGGVYEFPGKNVDCEHLLRMGGENFAFACLSETMIRALEGQKISGGIGQIKPDEIQQIGELVNYYGFKIAAWRMYDQTISQEAIERFKYFVTTK